MAKVERHNLYDLDTYLDCDTLITMRSAQAAFPELRAYPKLGIALYNTCIKHGWVTVKHGQVRRYSFQAVRLLIDRVKDVQFVRSMSEFSETSQKRRTEYKTVKRKARKAKKKAENRDPDSLPWE